MAQARDSTPEPITAVIMCELAVQTFPVLLKYEDICYINNQEFPIQESLFDKIPLSTIHD